MKLKLKKNTVMQLSNDLDVVPLSQTKNIAGGGDYDPETHTCGCTGTHECEQSGQCNSSPFQGCGTEACGTGGGSGGCGGATTK